MYRDNERLRKILEVARMYYIENFTQNEIAKELNISRPSVSKLLNEAKESGIVTISINSPFSSNELLLEKIIEKYKLKGGEIILDKNENIINDEDICKKGIEFLSENLKGIKNFGLGWGTLIEEMLLKLEVDKIRDLKGKIVPLIGNTNLPFKGYHTNELVRIFSEKTKVSPLYLFAPAYLTGRQEQEIVKNLENYQDIEKHWNNLESVVIEICSHPSVPDMGTAVRFGKKLNEEKAVGNILAYYYDKNGKIIEGDNDFPIQIPLESLKKIKQVIGIVSFKTNKNAVIGALNLGIFTHIIISERVAREL